MHKGSNKNCTGSCQSCGKDRNLDQLPIWFRMSRKMHLGAISNWVRHFRKFRAFSNY